MYGLFEGENISEASPLLAIDPYGESKMLAEELVKSWCEANRVEFYILRLPLIAGKNPPGNLGDMIQGLKTGRYARIGLGQACKSVLLASDVARLVTNINGPSGIYNLTDSYNPSFAELEDKIVTDLNLSKPKTLPFFMAKTIALVGDIIGDKFPFNSGKLKKINSTLTFSDERAKKLIGWSPSSVLESWDLKS